MPITIPYRPAGNAVRSIAGILNNFDTITALLNAGLTSEYLGTNSVGADELGNLAVDTGAIVDKAVTPAKVGILDHVSVYRAAGPTALVNGDRKQILWDTARKESGVGATLWGVGAAGLYAPRDGLYLVTGDVSVIVSADDVWRVSACISRYTNPGAFIADYAFQGTNLKEAHVHEDNGHQINLSQVVPMDGGDWCAIEVFAQFASGAASIAPSNAGENRYAAEGSLTYMGPLA